VATPSLARNCHDGALEAVAQPVASKCWRLISAAFVNGNENYIRQKWKMVNMLMKAKSYENKKKWKPEINQNKTRT